MRHGSIFRLGVLGQGEWIIAGDPELVRMLFKMNADELHGDLTLSSLFGPETILFKNGEAHRRRPALTPPFKHQRLAYASTMVGTWTGSSRRTTGAETTVQSLVVDVSLGTIIECIRRRRPEARARLARLFKEWMHTVQHPRSFSRR